MLQDIGYNSNATHDNTIFLNIKIYEW